MNQEPSRVSLWIQHCKQSPKVVLADLGIVLQPTNHGLAPLVVGGALDGSRLNATPFTPQVKPRLRIVHSRKRFPAVGNEVVHSNLRTHLY